MIIQKEVQALINKIASDKNIPVKTVHDIVMSEFEYLSAEIRSSEHGKPSTYKNILFKYLGTFYFNYKKDYCIAKAKGDDLTEFMDNKKWRIN